MRFSRQEGCHFLLQEIFLTQGSKPGLLHCSRFFTSEPPGKPSRILEWVAVSYSRGSSPSRDPTRVSYISCSAGGLPLSHLGSRLVRCFQNKQASGQWQFSFRGGGCLSLPASLWVDGCNPSTEPLPVGAPLLDRLPAGAAGEGPSRFSS